MKSLIAACLCACLAVGCAPAAMPASDDLPQAILMKISCKDDASLHEEIQNLLHVKKAHDIMVDRENGWLYMQATFIIREVPLYAVQDLQTDLRSMSGMSTVDLEWNQTGTYTSPSTFGHQTMHSETQLIH